MRRISVFIAMMALVFNVHAADDWANFGRYAKSNQEVKALPQNQRKAVFMGNSITDNWASRRQSFFQENGYVGRGIGGQTTYQMVLRFYEDVICLHPKAVVINGGTNDIAQNNHNYVEDRTFQNIVTMAQMAKAHGIKVILTSITPVEQYVWRKEITDVPAKIKSLNARIREYAKKNKFQYVDYWTPMANERGGMRDGLSEDGCHPTPEGYDIMEPLVKAAIMKVAK